MKNRAVIFIAFLAHSAISFSSGVGARAVGAPAGTHSVPAGLASGGGGAETFASRRPGRTHPKRVPDLGMGRCPAQNFGRPISLTEWAWSATFGP